MAGREAGRMAVAAGLVVCVVRRREAAAELPEKLQAA